MEASPVLEEAARLGLLPRLQAHPCSVEELSRCAAMVLLMIVGAGWAQAPSYLAGGSTCRCLAAAAAAVVSPSTQCPEAICALTLLSLPLIAPQLPGTV